MWPAENDRAQISEQQKMRLIYGFSAGIGERTWISLCNTSRTILMVRMLIARRRLAAIGDGFCVHLSARRSIDTQDVSGCCRPREQQTREEQEDDASF